MPSPFFHSVTIISAWIHPIGIKGDTNMGPEVLKRQGIIKVIRNKGVAARELSVPSFRPFQGVSGNLELIRQISELVRSAHDTQSFPLVLAPNCNATVGVAAGSSHAASQLGQELGCIWFDAHADFNTPNMITSGRLDCMAIAMMGGLRYKEELSSVPGFKALDLGKLVHVGLRDVNDTERGNVEAAQLSAVWGREWPKVDFVAELRTILDEKRIEEEPTLIHVDADCLNTSIGRANHLATPGGLLKEDLVGSLQTIVAKSTPLALTLASFAPEFAGADCIAEVLVESVSSFVDSLISKGMLEYDDGY